MGAARYNPAKAAIQNLCEFSLIMVMLVFLPIWNDPRRFVARVTLVVSTSPKVQVVPVLISH
jgi:hypothetical protein